MHFNVVEGSYILNKCAFQQYGFHPYRSEIFIKCISFRELINYVRNFSKNEYPPGPATLIDRRAAHV